MASIQKKNNKYCVVYYCKDTEGKRKQKRNSAIQLSETSFFRENVDGWTILLCVNQSVIVKKIKK